MNLTLTIVHKTRKTNKLYYTGDDPTFKSVDKIAKLTSEM